MNLKQKKSNLMGEIVKANANYTRAAHTQRDRLSIRPVHMHGTVATQRTIYTTHPRRSPSPRYTAARERAKASDLHASVLRIYNSYSGRSRIARAGSAESIGGHTQADSMGIAREQSDGAHSCAERSKAYIGPHSRVHTVGSTAVRTEAAPPVRFP